jgi:hypothetical protein
LSPELQSAIAAALAEQPDDEGKEPPVYEYRRGFLFTGPQEESFSDVLRKEMGYQFCANSAPSPDAERKVTVRHKARRVYDQHDLTAFVEKSGMILPPEVAAWLRAKRAA